MATYTVTAAHPCRRCGFTATSTQHSGIFEETARPSRPAGWLDFAWPTTLDRILFGELCPECVAAVTAFIMSPKE